MNRTAWHVAILIPARNEERLIERCLQSVLEACWLLPSHVKHDIVVVSDGSTDSTSSIADRLLQTTSGITVVTEEHNVGRARAFAAQVAFARCTGPLQQCWLANTDADCKVPSNWLTQQLTRAEQGWDAVAGIVDVDSFEDHDAGVPGRFRASYITHPDGTHPHVHGANLGLRADAYLNSGGWAPLATAEDHDLWERLRRQGFHLLADANISVLTSGRRVGRAPLGFADALAMHNGVA